MSNKSFLPRYSIKNNEDPVPTSPNIDMNTKVLIDSCGVKLVPLSKISGPYYMIVFIPSNC